MTQEIDLADTIRRLVEGYQVSQAIHVIATLGVADLLVDGARTSDDLAVRDEHASRGALPGTPRVGVRRCLT